MSQRKKRTTTNSWRGNTPLTNSQISSPAFAHMRRSSSTASRRSSAGSTYHNRRDSYRPPVSPFPTQEEEGGISVTSLMDSLPRIKDTISIPIASVGCVMGPQGSIMKELRRQSGALIVLQQRSEMRPDAIRRGLTLTGTIEQITLAKRLIAQCVSNDVLTERTIASPVPPRGTPYRSGGARRVSSHSSNSMYPPSMSNGLIHHQNTSSPMPTSTTRRYSRNDRPDPTLYSPQFITGRRSPSRSPPHSPPFNSEDESSVRKPPPMNLMFNRGGFRLARGPDSTFGFRRKRSSIDDKHMPLKPLKSDESMLDTPSSTQHVPLRPIIEPKVSSDSYEHNNSEDVGDDS